MKIKEDDTLKLKFETLTEYDNWDKREVIMPLFPVGTMKKQSKEAATWVHFGGGNIFRGFIASLQQRLLNRKLVDTGIIMVEPFDEEIVDKIYDPYDNLTMNVSLEKDGTAVQEIIASVAEAVKGSDLSRLRDIFTADSLQILSFTVTEKGYSLHDGQGNFLPVVEEDFAQGLTAPKHSMALVCSLLHSRFQAGAKPIALVSMDNCNANGDKLKEAVLTFGEKWLEKGMVSAEFVEYLQDKKKVSFPWTMIDKITPHPVAEIGEKLGKMGIEDMTAVVTEKGTHIAPYVNGERCQYLVVEDQFPNGRPPLEEAGVRFGKRDYVEKAESMKVCTCLNPLHTAMSLFASLLKIDTVAEAMNSDQIGTLLKVLGYVEGLPVAQSPKDMDAKEFLNEVFYERLPNAVLTDVPQRITTDTSQKVGIRFGETVKAHQKKGNDLNDLVAIPLVLAGWFRYLLAVDDNGHTMHCSNDPMLAELQSALSTVDYQNPSSYTGQLLPFLQNQELFYVDYVALGLSDKIEKYFVEMLRGVGSVKQTLFETMLPLKTKIR